MESGPLTARHPIRNGPDQPTRRPDIGSNLHTFISSRLAWPLLHGPWRLEQSLARQYYAEKVQDAGLPASERLTQADGLLGNIFAWAGSTVPYWREVFSSAGIDPNGIGNPREVLQSLPVTTRDMLQERKEDLRSERWQELVPRVNHSGGSTGTPVEFYSDRESRARTASSAWYADSAAGWYPGADTAVLWGADSEVRERRSALGAFKLWARNVRLYNTFATSEEKLLSAHRAMNRRPPEMLIGYAGSLHLLARLLIERGERAGYPLRGVISSAETLSAPMRDDLGRVFGPDKIFNRYGCREVGLIAHECPRHNGLHVNIDDLVVEVVDDDGKALRPGETGRVLVTALRQCALPLIRYDLGDTATWAEGTCDCGDSAPRLAHVTGRSSDTIRTAEGKLIHGEYFTHLFYGATPVRRFQFVQRTPRSYFLRYEAGENLSDDLERKLRSDLSAQLGADSVIEFERCEQIEPSPSGKYKFTLSLVGDKRDA